MVTRIPVSTYAKPAASFDDDESLRQAVPFVEQRKHFRMPVPADSRAGSLQIGKRRHRHSIILLDVSAGGFGFLAPLTCELTVGNRVTLNTFDGTHPVRIVHCSEVGNDLRVGAERCFTIDVDAVLPDLAKRKSSPDNENAGISLLMTMLCAGALGLAGIGATRLIDSTFARNRPRGNSPSDYQSSPSSAREYANSSNATGKQDANGTNETAAAAEARRARLWLKQKRRRLTSAYSQLGLTESQRQKLQQIENNDSQSEAAAMAQLAEVLTPEQRAEFRRLLDKEP